MRALHIHTRAHSMCRDDRPVGLSVSFFHSKHLTTPISCQWFQTHLPALPVISSPIWRHADGPTVSLTLTAGLWLLLLRGNEGNGSEVVMALRYRKLVTLTWSILKRFVSSEWWHSQFTVEGNTEADTSLLVSSASWLMFLIIFPEFFQIWTTVLFYK